MSSKLHPFPELICLIGEASLLGNRPALRLSLPSVDGSRLVPLDVAACERKWSELVMGDLVVLRGALMLEGETPVLRVRSVHPSEEAKPIALGAR